MDVALTDKKIHQKSGSKNCLVCKSKYKTNHQECAPQYEFNFIQTSE